jgi:hypothetical protein
VNHSKIDMPLLILLTPPPPCLLDTSEVPQYVLVERSLPTLAFEYTTASNQIPSDLDYTELTRATETFLSTMYESIFTSIEPVEYERISLSDYSLLAPRLIAFDISVYFRESNGVVVPTESQVAAFTKQGLDQGSAYYNLYLSHLQESSFGLFTSTTSMQLVSDSDMLSKMQNPMPPENLILVQSRWTKAIPPLLLLLLALLLGAATWSCCRRRRNRSRGKVKRKRHLESCNKAQTPSDDENETVTSAMSDFRTAQFSGQVTLSHRIDLVQEELLEDKLVAAMDGLEDVSLSDENENTEFPSTRTTTDECDLTTTATVCESEIVSQSVRPAQEKGLRVPIEPPRAPESVPGYFHVAAPPSRLSAATEECMSKGSIDPSHDMTRKQDISLPTKTFGCPVSDEEPLAHASPFVAPTAERMLGHPAWAVQPARPISKESTQTPVNSKSINELTAAKPVWTPKAPIQRSAKDSVPILTSQFATDPNLIVVKNFLAKTTQQQPAIAAKWVQLKSVQTAVPTQQQSIAPLKPPWATKGFLKPVSLASASIHLSQPVRTSSRTSDSVLKNDQVHAKAMLDTKNVESTEQASVNAICHNTVEKSPSDDDLRPATHVVKAADKEKPSFVAGVHLMPGSQSASEPSKTATLALQYAENTDANDFRQSQDALGAKEEVFRIPGVSSIENVATEGVEHSGSQSNSKNTARSVPSPFGSIDRSSEAQAHKLVTNAHVPTIEPACEGDVVAGELGLAWRKVAVERWRRKAPLLLTKELKVC